MDRYHSATDTTTTKLQENRDRMTGSEIKVLRISAGVGQGELAGEAGIHRTALGHIEAARRNTSEKMQARLLEALDRIRDHKANREREIGRRVLALVEEDQVAACGGRPKT